MHPRWLLLMGGLGALDVAYIDFVLGPRLFPAAAAPAESAPAAPPSDPRRPRAAPAAREARPPATAESAAPAAALAEAPAPAGVAEPAPASEAPVPELDEAALEHERPPGETWWIVNFSEGGAGLNPAAEQQLGEIAQRVAASHDVRINIIGHADARGADDYNQKLGQRRAHAVADALLRAGFRREQIEITSRGEAAPAVLGASREAWASNRRAEIEIQAVRKSEAPRRGRESTPRESP